MAVVVAVVAVEDTGPAKVVVAVVAVEDTGPAKVVVAVVAVEDAGPAKVVVAVVAVEDMAEVGLPGHVQLPGLPRRQPFLSLAVCPF